MKLLDIAPDGLSLEFFPYEEEMVRERLGAFGAIEVQHEATFDRLIVDGAEFLYLNEWDEPCLIAANDAGQTVLRAIADPQSAPPRSAESRKAPRWSWWPRSLRS